MKQAIVHVIPSLAHGGAEMVLLTLLQELQYTANHHVIYCYDGPLTPQFEALSLTLHKVSIIGGTRTPLFAYKLLQLLKQIQPQAIHTSLWTPNFWGRIVARYLNIRCYAALHTVVEHEGFIRNSIDKIINIRETSYIAVSPTIVNSLQHHKKFINNKVFLIENGIALQHSKTVQNPFITNEKLFVIGSVGRFVPVKQYDLLLQSFAVIHKNNSHTRLVLIGYGPEETKLRTLAQQLHIASAVYFIINQPAQDYYQFFDCFVQTSAQEGLSIAVLEAMASQLPVIAPATQTTHPVIHHMKTGLLWNTPEDISTLLELILKNKDIAQTIGSAAQCCVEKYYSSAIMAHKYQQLFEHNTLSTKR